MPRRSALLPLLPPLLLLGHVRANCFIGVLQHLSTSPHNCLHREDLSYNISFASIVLPRFPVYVLHAPWLVRRHSHMKKQLLQLGAADVTWVKCANRDDVNALTPQQRSCAYPCVQMNRYSEVNRTTGFAKTLSNGTVSLALKHKLAAWDILRRRIAAALILEDDAVLPPELWTWLMRLRPPPSCQLFWMGSYSKRTNVGTLSAHTRVGDSVFRRNASMFPVILGAVSYVLYQSGAEIVAHEPVTTPADIAISLFPREGVTHSAKGTDAGVGAEIGGGGLPYRTFPDGVCEDASGRRFEQRTPPEQYGPLQWLIWPVPREEQELRFGDHGGTHNVGRRLLR